MDVEGGISLIAGELDGLHRASASRGLREEREAWELLNLQRLLVSVAVEEASPDRAGVLVLELERISRFMEAHHPLRWQAFSVAERNARTDASLLPPSF